MQLHDTGDELRPLLLGMHTEATALTKRATVSGCRPAERLRVVSQLTRVDARGRLLETHDAVVLFTRTMLAREAVSRRSAMRMPISLGRSVSWKEARARRAGAAGRRGG